MATETKCGHRTILEELAAALGKPQSYVAKVENFDRRLDVVELADWLNALRTAPPQLPRNLPWL